MKITLPPQILAYARKARPVVRHHYFMASMVVLGGLVTAVYVVNQTLGMPSDENYRQEKLNSSLKSTFDKATIDKIEALKRSSEQANSPSPTPSGTRTNPFAE